MKMAQLRLPATVLQLKEMASICHLDSGQRAGARPLTCGEAGSRHHDARWNHSSVQTVEVNSNYRVFCARRRVTRVVTSVRDERLIRANARQASRSRRLRRH